MTHTKRKIDDDALNMIDEDELIDYNSNHKVFNFELFNYNYLFRNLNMMMIMRL